MPYQPYYPGGWQPGPGGGTPISADALNHMEGQYDAVMAETTSPGGTEPNRLAVTDASGAVGLAKDTQAVGGVLASSIARIATGSYVGDGSTSDRLIHVGFAPLMVYVVGNSGASTGLGLGMAGATHGIAKAQASSSLDLQKQPHAGGQDVPVPTADGFIVRSHDTRASLNHNGVTYVWVAIGAVGA